MITAAQLQLKREHKAVLRRERINRIRWNRIHLNNVVAKYNKAMAVAMRPRPVVKVEAPKDNVLKRTWKRIWNRKV